MRRVLVAGASGSLGRYALEALHRRGWQTRALRRKAGLQDLPADGVVYGDALRQADVAPAMVGVDVVFSCLGQTVSADMNILRPGYREVDVPANRNLLEAAKKAGVRRFVYVSVLGAERYPGVAYLAAHAEVARLVQSSGLGWGVVAPTGFFSAFRAFLDMARKNQAVVFGDGATRTNPIHEADLAEVCADMVESTESKVLEAGGPKVYQRREVLELAFQALGRPAKIRQAPLWLPRLMSWAGKPVAPRIADLMQFVAVLSEQDFVGPAVGRRTLEDYFSSIR